MEVLLIGLDCGESAEGFQGSDLEAEDVREWLAERKPLWDENRAFKEDFELASDHITWTITVAELLAEWGRQLAIAMPTLEFQPGFSFPYLLVTAPATCTISSTSPDHSPCVQLQTQPESSHPSGTGSAEAATAAPEGSPSTPADSGGTRNTFTYDPRPLPFTLSASAAVLVLLAVSVLSFRLNASRPPAPVHTTTGARRRRVGWRH
nr:unnamed protein product [Digitaria exilis]